MYNIMMLTAIKRWGFMMKVEIKRKLQFNIAGVERWIEDSSECPAVWKELFDSYLPTMLAKIGDGTSYGVLYGAVEGKNGINYMAGFDVANVEEARTLGMKVQHIEENDYAIVPLEGPVPQCIHDGWDHLYKVFFPQTGYRHSSAPDIEVYGDGDMTRRDYQMELWVPVVKDQK